MRFLDRTEELARLGALLAKKDGRLAVVYGRRRTGKSRLVQEALRGRPAVYYVGDDRESALQRAALAAEMARLVPGFADVTYPDWEALFARFWREAPPGAVLALDELPSLVTSDGAIPSILQKLVDRRDGRRPHLVLAGSSQRLMQGLVLDRSAPLFGRAGELMRLAPLGARWIGRALGLSDPVEAVEAYALWGGVPRYWELALDHAGLLRAFEALVLSPLGVLHDEPRRLLLDDLRETTQPLSVLALIGRGCHRLSEIAGRLEKPATSLARPLASLVELGLVRRDLPFGVSLRESKRTAYRLGDPFLRAWFRFVEPNRSRLEAGLSACVAREVEVDLGAHVSGVWEDLVRESVPRGEWLGREWSPAAPWWGSGSDRRPLEVDVVAEHESSRALLVGEVKWSERLDWDREIAALRDKASRLPIASGRELRLALWTKRAPPKKSEGGVELIGAKQVIDVLR